MLKRRVGRKDGVVGLDNGTGQLWCGVDTELELRLLSVFRGEAFKEESTEPRSSPATERVEDEKALEAVGVVRKATKLFHGWVDELLADSVVSTCIYQREVMSKKDLEGRKSGVCTVVRSVLFSCQHCFRVEKGSIGASLDLVDNTRLQVDVERARDILAGARLRKEG